MVMAGGLNAKNIAVTSVGGLFFYPGIKGLKISVVARDLISGKDLTTDPAIQDANDNSQTPPSSVAAPGEERTGGALPVPSISGEARQTQAALSTFIHAGPNGQIPAQTDPLDTGPRIN